MFRAGLEPHPYAATGVLQIRRGHGRRSRHVVIGLRMGKGQAPFAITAGTVADGLGTRPRDCRHHAAAEREFAAGAVGAAADAGATGATDGCNAAAVNRYRAAILARAAADAGLAVAANGDQRASGTTVALRPNGDAAARNDVDAGAGVPRRAVAEDEVHVAGHGDATDCLNIVEQHVPTVAKCLLAKIIDVVGGGLEMPNRRVVVADGRAKPAVQACSVKIVVF